MDADGDGRKELLVAPLFGIDTGPPDYSGLGIELYLLRIPPQPQTDHWVTESIDDTLHVCHAAVAVQLDRDPPQEVLTGSFEGVNAFKRTPTGPWIKMHLGDGEQI